MVHNPVTICAKNPADDYVTPLKHDGNGNLVVGSPVGGLPVVQQANTRFSVTPTAPHSAPDISISGGESLSDLYDFGDVYRPAMLITGLEWDTADITFVVSSQAAGYVEADLYTVAGTEYKITGAQAGRAYPLDPAIFGGVRFMRIRSGTAGAPVNQTDGVQLHILQSLR